MKFMSFGGGKSSVIENKLKTTSLSTRKIYSKRYALEWIREVTVVQV
jgi:hypothetical protein